MSIDMSQFYQVFFEETSEHLANMENLLLLASSQLQLPDCQSNLGNFMYKFLFAF